MNFIQSLVLAIIQGFTEFLPISSSGHLTILQNYMGIKEHTIFFNMMLHAGTLGSVVVFFRKELYLIILSIVRFKTQNKERSLYRQIILAVIVGTIPTAFLGFALSKVKDLLFYGAIFAAFMLIFTGFFLWLGERISINTPISNKKQKIGIKDALFIGIMQGVAIMPGVSRSGITISAGIMRGLERKLSFQYSFLLFIPVMIGAIVLEGRDIHAVPAASLFPLLIGTITAFVVGIIALKILKKVLTEKKFAIFYWYCWILGGGVLFFEVIKLLT